MSKIGKQPIMIPSGVTISHEDNQLTVSGPKGTLIGRVPSAIQILVNEGVANVSLKNEKGDPAIWGLWRALLSNMVIGVSNGWDKRLEFQGVGYKAAVKGNDLELSLGYSHPVVVSAPDGISFAVDKNSIVVRGIDKELVGQVAAIIRSKRLPEPYKGSGIRYSDEVIHRKVGKKAATA